jgi:uncharacterized SAM-binding protein YcdF (DUF218 family)
VKRRRIVLGLSLGVLASVGAATARLFIWAPDGPTPIHADAVVVLSGGRGDRLPKALALMDASVAPVLVISRGVDQAAAQTARVCAERTTFEVNCVRPDPNTTRGEANAIARVASERGWHSLVVVTSRYHLTRARLLIGRCVRAHVTMVASTPARNLLNWTGDVVHEWGGLAYALLVQRGC